MGEVPWYPPLLCVYTVFWGFWFSGLCVVGVFFVCVWVFCLLVFGWFVLGRSFPWEPPKHWGCFDLVIALSCALRPCALISSLRCHRGRLPFWRVTHRGLVGRCLQALLWLVKGPQSPFCFWVCVRIPFPVFSYNMVLGVFCVFWRFWWNSWWCWGWAATVWLRKSWHLWELSVRRLLCHTVRVHTVVRLVDRLKRLRLLVAKKWRKGKKCNEYIWPH